MDLVNTNVEEGESKDYNSQENVSGDFKKEDKKKETILREKDSKEKVNGKERQGEEESQKSKNQGERRSDVYVSDQKLNSQEKKFSEEIKPENLKDAQNLLLQLRLLLLESETPGLEALTDVLLRVQELLDETAQKPDIDPVTRKTLIDISALLITAKQMGKNKGIADRLQRISDESQKALDSIRRSGVPDSTVKETEEAVDFVTTWRPVFQLLIRSSKFRELFVNSVKIVRSVVSRKSEGVIEISDEDEYSDEEVSESEDEKKSHMSHMTNEEWENLQNEIQKVLVVLARKPSYSEGINRIFKLFDMFRRDLKEAKPSDSTDVLEAESHVERARQETEELVASFSGRETFDQFKKQLRKLIQLLDTNPNLKKYLNELKKFILRSKSEQEVKSEEITHKSRDLANRGRELMQQYKDENVVDNFLTSCEVLINNIKKDQFVRVLRHQAGMIRSDLSYVDNDGNVQLDTNMISLLQSVLLPVLANTLKYIPFPRMESSDDNREFWLDNILLCGFDIIPENIHFRLESESELSLNDTDSKGSQSHLVITLDKLRTELKEMKFFYKKKTFPEITDNGIVSLRIVGDGAQLNINFTIEQNSGDPHPRLVKGYADFHIRKMDIELDKTTLQHDVVLPILTTIFKQQIQLEIEKVVETTLTKIIQGLGDQLTDTLSDINQPFFIGLETAKNALKTTELHKASQRRQKLE
jgi:hypothetical protein